MNDMRMVLKDSTEKFLIMIDELGEPQPGTVPHTAGGSIHTHVHIHTYINTQTHIKIYTYIHR
jgi:hypothetical protein